MSLTAAVFNDGLLQKQQTGMGFPGMKPRVTSAFPTDTAFTIDPVSLMSGILAYSFTVTRNVTCPTGTDLDAAFPDMQIGDTFMIIITGSGSGTVVANTGVTISGSSAYGSGVANWVLVTKTGAATYTWRVMN